MSQQHGYIAFRYTDTIVLYATLHNVLCCRRILQYNNKNITNLNPVKVRYFSEEESKLLTQKYQQAQQQKCWATLEQKESHPARNYAAKLRN